MYAVYEKINLFSINFLEIGEEIEKNTKYNNIWTRYNLILEEKVYYDHPNTTCKRKSVYRINKIKTRHYISNTLFTKS